jgi:hypothetical protein
MARAALALFLLLLAAPAVVAQPPRACEEDREQLRVLARHLSESRLGIEAQLAEAQVREQALRRQLEELKAAAKTSAEPKK